MCTALNTLIYDVHLYFHPFYHQQKDRQAVAKTDERIDEEKVTGIVPAVSRWCGRLADQPFHIPGRELLAAGPSDLPQPASSCCSTREKRYNICGTQIILSPLFSQGWGGMEISAYNNLVLNVSYLFNISISGGQSIDSVPEMQMLLPVNNLAV